MKFRSAPFRVSVWIVFGFVFGCISGLAGCSSLREANNRNREFKIESSWTRQTTQSPYIGFRRMNRMTPIVTDQMVIQANAIDGIIAYRRGDGTELWRRKLVNGVEGGAQLVGDRLYFGASDGEFYALSVMDGRTIWTAPVRAETLAPPTIENGVVYFESGADVVYALDASTGKQIWLYNRQVTGNLSIRASTRPVVAGENLLVGFSDGFLVALRKRDGGLVWERKLGKSLRFRDVDATPVVDGSDIFVASFDAALYSLNAESGEVNWSLDDGAYVPVTLGTGRFSDRLFYSTATGKILAVEKKTGRVFSTLKINKGIPTQATLFKGFIVYGESEGGLVVADPENGQTVGRFDPGYGVVSRPAVIGSTGEAYFLSNGANLYALKMGYQRGTDLMPWQTATGAQRIRE